MSEWAERWGKRIVEAMKKHKPTGFGILTGYKLFSPNFLAVFGDKNAFLTAFVVDMPPDESVLRFLQDAFPNQEFVIIKCRSMYCRASGRRHIVWRWNGTTRWQHRCFELITTETNSLWGLEDEDEERLA